MKRLTNAHVYHLAIELFLVAVVLYGLAVWVFTKGVGHELCVNLALAVAIPAAVTVVWATLSGRWLAEEVMEKVGITRELQQAGVGGAKSFKDVDWDELFLASGQLDVWAAWARSWAIDRNPHLLRELVSRDDSRLRVLLPDPDDTSTVSALCHLFPTRTSEYVQGHINEVIRFYSEDIASHASNSGVVEVWVTTSLPAFSCYVFNGARAVLAPMTHTPSPDYVPAFVLGPGEVLNHVMKELRFLLEEKATLRFTNKPPRTE